ncbi:MAG: peptidoglycan DD-metalloendopeptidase family protein [bacterium]
MNRYICGFLVTVLFTLILAFPSFLNGADRKQEGENYKESIHKSKEELESVIGKLKEKEKEYKSTKQNKEKLSRELKSLDKELLKAQEDINTLDKGIKIIKQDQEKTKENLEISKGDLKHYRENLEQEIRVVYKEKTTNKLPWFFSSKESFGYFLRNENALNSLISRNYESFVSAERNVEVLTGKSENLAKQKSQKQSQFKQNVSNRIKYTKEKGKKDKLLTSAEEKQIEQEKELQVLKATSQSMEKLITELKAKAKAIEKKRLEKFGVAKHKGNLIWPVTGEVTSLFGRYKHPEMNAYLVNNGIEIKSSKSDVLAVEEGAVLFASDFKGYGKTVIIEHSGNFCTVYSHLDVIKVDMGKRIKKKEIIGTIDSSLYFEIRLENKPEDPLLWLTSE